MRYARLFVFALLLAAFTDPAHAQRPPTSARDTTETEAHGLQTAGVQMEMAPTVGGPRGKQVGLALRVRF